MAEYEPTFGRNVGDEGPVDGDSADAFNAVAAPFLSANIGGGGADSAASNDRDSGGATFDANIHVARDRLNADGTYRRKRASGGRGDHSAGPRAKKRADNKTGIDGLTKMLYIMHLGIAQATQSPEMILTDDDAKMLAEASANVLSEFDIRPSPKAEAIVALVMAAGSIYGPRAYLIRERLKKAKPAKDDNVARPFSVVQ